MIATAAAPDTSVSSIVTGSDHVTLIVDPSCSLQYSLQGPLQTALRERFNTSSTILSSTELNRRTSPVQTLIVVAELTGPILKSMDAATFSALQGLLMAAKAILWVTGAAEPHVSHFADLNMITGLARVLCTERSTLGFVTLALEYHSAQPERWTQRISQIYDCLQRDQDFCSLEYVENDSVLMTNRVLKAPRMNRELQRRRHPTANENAWEDVPALNLTIPDPGLLDSLRFEQDLLVDEELGPEEIEIQVLAVGINFRDLLVGLGKLPANTVGCECAGVVTRIGARCTTFDPGQRVCAVVMGCMRTFARCSYKAAVQMPPSMTLEEAASVPVTGATAYHALIQVADLRQGETILIHSAGGGTGQMALQIAQSIGVEIFVTVGTEEKKQLLKDRYQVPDDHIFGRRDTSFARDLSRATMGKGVDVVLNSLSGQALTASWEVIAPYGRFVEIGKADIENNAKLPMVHFAKNVSFSAIALDHMAMHRPALIGKALSGVMRMISEGTVKVAHPLDMYPISSLQTAFRTMQKGTNVGKMVLTMSQEDKVKTYMSHVPKYTLDSDATYLIAGGLAGLGRSAARWMVQRGARSLILLSRSGPKTPAAQDLVGELTQLGVRVATPKCDVASEEELAATLAACADMPPIKGCMQATMDALFETMTWKQWSTSITSKVTSTWNLHHLLPNNLSFFIMLSSVAGIAGSVGQSDYAAGNTYQDAIAKHRLAHGQKAVSIDLGWMGDVGIVAENANLTKGKEDAADLAQMFEIEFLALLDFYCEPNLDLNEQNSQPILGLVTAEQFRSKGIPPPARLMERPLFKPLALTSAASTTSFITSSQPHLQDRDLSTSFINASSPDDQISLVTSSLVSKLARALTMSEEEIDQSRPLHVYGVDSLLAVELRNWFARVFKTDVGFLTLRDRRR